VTIIAVYLLTLTNTRRFSIKVAGVKTWNAIPSRINQASKIYMFKILLRDHLLNDKVLG